ncbi:MAG: DUF378 domain-containing protein [bacterium]
MNKLSTFDWLVIFLLVVGGLNWGLVGFFRFDLIASMFGELSAISRIIYSLVGLAAVYMAVISATLAKK